MTSPTVDRRYGLNASSAIKVPVRVATTANITLSGLQSIDSVTVAAGDRVLVKNQTNAVNNGIYIADTGSWTRDVDFNGARDIVKGTIITVNEGATKARSLWRITTENPITIGSSSLSFVENVASSTDSSNITFLQSGTGAVAMTVQDKERLRFDAFDFGLTGDGSNESTKMQNLFNAGQGGTIVLGHGKTYVLSTMPVIKGNGTKIIGNNSTFDVTDTAGGLDFELVGGTTYPVNINIQDLAIIARGAGSYGLRVRASYSTFRRVSVALPVANVSGRGIALIGHSGGTGPYYNTFLNCDVQSASAGADHIGIALIAGPAAAYLSPNANTFVGSRVGQCLRNYLIKGNGNSFHQAVSENAALTGTAFYFEGDSATNCQDNHIYGGYIENAAKAFEFNANASDCSATGVFGTGVTTWKTDSGTRNYLHTSIGAWSMPQGISFPAGATNDATTIGKYVASGSWTPTANSLTVVGTPTYTGTYMKIGRMVFWALTIASTTTTASTANLTNFTGLSSAAGVPRTSSPTMPAVSSAVAPFYGGYVDTAGTIYTPTWGATATVYISGVYEATT